MHLFGEHEMFVLFLIFQLDGCARCFISYFLSLILCHIRKIPGTSNWNVSWKRAFEARLTCIHCFLHFLQKSISMGPLKMCILFFSLSKKLLLLCLLQTNVLLLLIFPNLIMLYYWNLEFLKENIDSRDHL